MAAQQLTRRQIILNWNERLGDSPKINRALSNARSSVIILAPLDVELGSLPASVKGVISGELPHEHAAHILAGLSFCPTGFGTRSLELARPASDAVAL
jgi:hypothetical protein